MWLTADNPAAKFALTLLKSKTFFYEKDRINCSGRSTHSKRM